MIMYNLARKTLHFYERIGFRLKAGFLGRHRFGRTVIDLFLIPSDLSRILTSYRARFGKYPNLLRPEKFNEFLQRSKLINRKNIHTIWADKLLVRGYVAEKIGEKYLTSLVWSGIDLGSLDKTNLPDKFVVKANQGSGSNIIVLDRDSFDWDDACERTQKWLKQDYSIFCAEWQYRWIPPRIIIEELLEADDGKVPIDYKFFVFHGKVEYVQVDFNRFSGHRRNIYDKNFKKLDVKFVYPQYEYIHKKPNCFDKMIELAEILSNGEAFVRIDFYDVNGPVFGEITLHPEGGVGKFTPDDLDHIMGLRYLGKGVGAELTPEA